MGSQQRPLSLNFLYKAIHIYLFLKYNKKYGVLQHLATTLHIKLLNCDFHSNLAPIGSLELTMCHCLTKLFTLIKRNNKGLYNIEITIIFQRIAILFTVLLNFIFIRLQLYVLIHELKYNHMSNTLYLHKHRQIDVYHNSA